MLLKSAARAAGTPVDTLPPPERFVLLAPQFFEYDELHRLDPYASAQRQRRLQRSMEKVVAQLPNVALLPAEPENLPDYRLLRALDGWNAGVVPRYPTTLRRRMDGAGGIAISGGKRPPRSRRFPWSKRRQYHDDYGFSSSYRMWNDLMYQPTVTRFHLRNPRTLRGESGAGFSWSLEGNDEQVQRALEELLREAMQPGRWP